MSDEDPDVRAYRSLRRFLLPHPGAAVSARRDRVAKQQGRHRIMRTSILRNPQADKVLSLRAGVG